MTPMKKLLTASSLLAVAGLVACGGGGGGSSPAPAPTATALTYTDPTSGTYLLKKDTNLSSGSHLVLDLVGPTSGTASGVTLTLNADTTKVAWTNVASTDPANTLVQNGAQFSLGTGTPLLLARASGTTLMATVAQKGLAVSPASLNGVLLKVALDLKPNLGLAQGTTIQLSADGTKSLVLDGTKGSAPIGPITVSVGTLTAQ